MPADRGRTGADGPGAADAAFVVGAAALAGRDASPCPGCCQPRPVIARGLTRPPCDFIVELVIAKLGVGGSVGDLMLSAAGLEARPVREDVDLIAQIANGDIGDPVAELYRRYGGRLYRLGLQLLGDAGLAEELVQECFVRLWRTAGRFDLSRGTVAAYLFVMGRSIAADLRKRPSSRPLIPVEDALVPPQPDSADRIVEALMVRDALDSLSVAHREVLMLVHGEGLTQSQIAERLSLPLGTVKTRMFHGLRALRGALAERGYDG
jgi:RNA polymerase sigma-70 factor, ECF subfamily